MSFLAKEAEHVDGFAKECAVVTHHRLCTAPGGVGLIPDPEAKLEVVLFLFLLLFHLFVEFDLVIDLLKSINFMHITNAIYAFLHFDLSKQIYINFYDGVYIQKFVS